MSLHSGTRLGPYEITAAIGAGGMGEVFRGRDAKLNRDVAIKVLPAAFAQDPERLARFEREARLLASLNHPSVAHVYGFESAALPDGSTAHFLAMELVEGEDLAQRLARGPIPVDEAIAIAKQIAEGLEEAHEKGVVHRDLKPGNVKVTPDGKVKVLDFGLAKALEGDPSSSPKDSQISHSPTMSRNMTEMGVILGTAAYMSPEQARGRAVDRRTDIWAFGVVLYEMLTGRRAFLGDDVSITLANVLKDDPRFDALPRDLPEPIRRLLRRCLEKDPKRRLSAIADARLELDEAATRPDGTSTGAARFGMAGPGRWVWASVAGLALIAALAFALRSAPGRGVEAPTFRFGILPPGDGRWEDTPRMAISPDGQSLVFVPAAPLGGATPIWLRRLDSMDWTPVKGSESLPGRPLFPFWSPDSRQVAFFTQSPKAPSMTELRIADLQAGTSRMVVDLDLSGVDAAGTWNAEGVLLVATKGTGGVQRISADGGPLTQVTTLDASRGELFHLYPQFLPDGRHFIYQSQTSVRDNWAIFVGSIDSTDRRNLVQSEYARFAAPNLLLYTQGGNLVARTLDLRTQELTGQPVVIADGIASLPDNGRAGFCVSDTGVLVYKKTEGQGPVERELTWIDRRGKVLEVVGPRVTSTSMRLSPDGARVALAEPAGLWVADLARNVKAAVMPTRAGSPTWSADGTRLLFGSLPGGDAVLAERDALGATPMKALYRQEGVVRLVPFDETSDGRLVVFGRTAGSGKRGIDVLSKADGKVTPYLENGFTGSQAALSPDGKWLAYTSNESGSDEVIVQPFPDPQGGKWPVSPNGGSSPRWRRDGRELFYVDGEGRLVSVPVTAGPTFAPGRATPLFSLAGVGRGHGWSAGVPRGQGGAYGYDAAADGQRFLVSLAPNGVEAGPVVPVTVITNWTSLLKEQKK